MALADHELLSVEDSTHCQTTGNVAWEVRHGWDALLLGRDGLRLDEWLRSGQATVVKHGLHRTVYRIELSAGQVLFLKHYRSPQWFRAVRHLVRHSAARREWQAALELGRRQIPTAAPIALGEERRGGLVLESYYATEAIPAARSVDEFVSQVLPRLPATRQLELWRQLIRAMARLAARVHRAGVQHDDFHSGNVLVAEPAQRLERNDPQLYLIDVPNVRFSRPLDWASSRDSLVMLHAGWFDRLTQTDRLRFWQEYLAGRPELELAGYFRRAGLALPSAGNAPARQGKPCPTETADRRAAGSEVVARTRDFAHRVIEGRDKRVLGTNRDFYRLQLPGGVAHAISQMPRELLRELLDDPQRPLRQYRHWPVKLSHSSVVVEAEIQLASGTINVAYKRSRAKTWWKRLLLMFRPSRAMNGWRLGHALLQRGIATARPILACQPRRGLLPRDSFLATAWIGGAQDLHLYGWDLAKRESAECRHRTRQCAASLGRLLGRMHAWNVAHRDLKGCNLVVVEQPCGVDAYVIDLDGVQLKRSLSTSRRAQDLARLAAGLHLHPWITRTDRLRFLRAYLHELGPEQAADCKQLWLQIADRSRAVIDGMQELGQPVA